MLPSGPISYNKSQYSLIVGLASLFFLLSVAFVGRKHKLFSQEKPKETYQMVSAARHFLSLLDPNAKKRAVVSFQSQERTRWNSLSAHKQSGILLKSLNDQQKQALHAMLRSALSEQGYLKAIGVMQISDAYKDTLSPTDKKELTQPYGGPYPYTLTMFGQPSEDQPWGWRLEGHHLLLNFTVSATQIACTPMYMGAHPTQVPDGPYAGWQVVGAEADRARQLLASLDDRQHERAVSPVLPDDILTHLGTEPHLQTFEGIQAVDLNADQREWLMELIRTYVGNLNSKRAQVHYDKIRRIGLEELYFMWAGGSRPGEAMYYRIHGPTFIIEMAPYQHDPNHVHTVWHNLEDDFGLDFSANSHEFTSLFK